MDKLVDQLKRISEIELGKYVYNSIRVKRNTNLLNWALVYHYKATSTEYKRYGEYLKSELIWFYRKIASIELNQDLSTLQSIDQVKVLYVNYLINAFLSKIEPKIPPKISEKFRANIKVDLNSECDNIALLVNLTPKEYAFCLMLFKEGFRV